MTDANYLYVIAHPEGWRKVGFSRNPRRRLKQHQAHSGRPLVGEWIALLSSDPRPVEKAAHAPLANKRIMGEWFAVDAMTARDAIADATGNPAIAWSALPKSPIAKLQSLPGYPQMPPIYPRQCVAARRAIGWSQADLSEAILKRGGKLSVTSIQAFENGSAIRNSNATAIVQAIESAGMVLIPETDTSGYGVRRKNGGAGVRLATPSTNGDE